MEKHNCPNCGAPISSAKCPYCGTTFYDFTTISDRSPTYIKIKHLNSVVTCRVLLRSAAFETCFDANPVLNLEFVMPS